MKRTTITLLTTLIIANGFGLSSAMAAPGQGQGNDQGGHMLPHQQSGNQQQRPGNGNQQRPGNGDQHRPGNNSQGPHSEHGQPQSHSGRDRGPGGQPHQGGRQADRFAFHGNDFRRGHAAPERYRGEQYRVNNWHDRGLSRPPQGHYWAAINGNYVLMAAATGIITSIILNSALSQ